MLAKIGGFLYRRRISVLCISLAIVIGITAYGQGVFHALSSTNFNVDNSESSRAIALLRAKFGSSSTDVIILLRSNTLSATSAPFTQAATALLSELNKRPEVASLTSYYGTDTNLRSEWQGWPVRADLGAPRPQGARRTGASPVPTNANWYQSPDYISQDGHETFAFLQLKGLDSTTKVGEYTNLKPLLTSQTLQVTVGGAIPASIALNEQASDDLKRAETFTLPILVLLLLLVFGGVVAAGLPLLIGGVAILGSFAVLRGLSTVTNVSAYAINVATMLGLGLAIDYSLFIISRFREELSYNQQDVRAALAQTMATAGRTVIFSALTVGTGLLSLLLFPLNFLRSLGLGAISAIVVVMLVSLTILPVLLALLGPRVDILSFRRIFRSHRTPKAALTGEQRGMWYRFSEMIMRAPVPVVLITLVILFTLIWPFLHIKLATDDINSLPPDNEARIVSQKLGQDFASQGNAQLTIAITAPGHVLSPENLASLDSYVRSIQALPGVIHVQSLVTVSPDLDLAAYQRLYAHPGLNPRLTQVATNFANGDFTKIVVAIHPADHTSEATTLVKRIRALQAPGRLTALATGVTPIEIDTLAGLEETLPEAFLVIFAAIFVLLFLMTGSLIMPIKAVILNMLSLPATFGGLVWIFQDGQLRDLLHFGPSGSIVATNPIFIFAIAFGLSTDYEIFVLSRIKERFDETGNNRLAVSSGIQSTGRLVTSAALLLAVVLGGFSLARTVAVQETGIGLAIAVVMDATLIRMLLLPATMHLLGAFNWWAPVPLRWVWRHIGLVESQKPAQAPAEKVPVYLRNSSE